MVLVGKQNEPTKNEPESFGKMRLYLKESCLTEEELRCEKIFQETTIDGNHLVEIDSPDKDFHRLPWRRKRHVVK